MMFRELRRLNRLSKSSEGQIRSEGFTTETLEKTIEYEKRKVTRELNKIGWFIVVVFIFPLALMQVGLSLTNAAFTSYIVSGIILLLLYKLTGKFF